MVFKNLWHFKIGSVFNFAQNIVAKYQTFLYSRQNSRSSDICGVLMFGAKFVTLYLGKFRKLGLEKTVGLMDSLRFLQPSATI